MKRDQVSLTGDWSRFLCSGERVIGELRRARERVYHARALKLAVEERRREDRRREELAARELARSLIAHAPTWQAPRTGPAWKAPVTMGVLAAKLREAGVSA